MRLIIERGNLVSLGATCEGGYFQEHPHSVTDGDTIVPAIWRVPVELREFDEGKNTACMEEGL
jgi:hypothetical protein